MHVLTSAAMCTSSHTGQHVKFTLHIVLHFTSEPGLCKSVHSWEHVSEIQAIKKQNPAENFEDDSGVMS